MGDHQVIQDFDVVDPSQCKLSRYVKDADHPSGALVSQWNQSVKQRRADGRKCATFAALFNLKLPDEFPLAKALMSEAWNWKHSITYPGADYKQAFDNIGVLGAAGIAVEAGVWSAADVPVLPSGRAAPAAVADPGRGHGGAGSRGPPGRRGHPARPRLLRGARAPAPAARRGRRLLAPGGAGGPGGTAHPDRPGGHRGQPGRRAGQWQRRTGPAAPWRCWAAPPPPPPLSLLSSLSGRPG